MDANLFRSKMVAHGDTQADLAKVLSIGTNTLSFKISEKNDFKQSEIEIIAKRYNLTADEIKEIFFNRM